MTRMSAVAEKPRDSSYRLKIILRTDGRTYGQTMHYGIGALAAGLAIAAVARQGSK